MLIFKYIFWYGPLYFMRGPFHFHQRSISLSLGPFHFHQRPISFSPEPFGFLRKIPILIENHIKVVILTENRQKLLFFGLQNRWECQKSSRIHIFCQENAFKDTNFDKKNRLKVAILTTNYKNAFFCLKKYFCPILERFTLFCGI